MAYTKQTWVDRVVQYVRRFSAVEDSPGYITLTPQPGTVTEAGTPVDASRLNHIEDGIEALENANNGLVQAAGDLLYGSAADTLARLAIGAANAKLFVNAAGNAPEWSAGVKIGGFTRDLSTASGSQAVTGVGFKPGVILFFASANDGTSAMAIGAATAGITIGLAQLYNGFSWTGLYIPLNATSGEQKFTVSSFDADGFTADWTKTDSPTGTATIYYVALR